MHRFCLPQAGAVGDQVTFPPEEAAHALRVLRLSEGDQVEVFTGQGARFSATLLRADREEVCARLDSELPDTEAPVSITLYQGLPKADKLDFIVQKATELGARKLVPVMMSRSVVKLDGKEAAKKAERLSRIAMEAAKQCGRSCVMEVVAAMPWKQALKELSGHELAIIPWEEAHGLNMRAVYEAHPGAKDIAILIGPEGGISEEEAHAVEAQRITLGPRILRTETAAVAAVALAMSLWGDI